MKERILRAVERTDVEAIYAIECASFFSPWSRKSIEAELANPLSFGKVLIVDGQLIGYYLGWCVIDECSLSTIAVAPSFRRGGWGKVLMEDFLREGKARGAEIFRLEVSVHNESALRLYRQWGFTVLRIRKNYYEAEAEDAYEMVVVRPAPLFTSEER